MRPHRLAGLALAIAMATTVATVARAGEVTIVDARATRTGERVYTFDVTLAHADSGWDHYADRWEVLAPDGAVLGTRVLLHPHENEQPFTRSLSGVAVPDGIATVSIRAHDLVHGDGPQTFGIDLAD